jgi:hypothetical protein
VLGAVKRTLGIRGSPPSESEKERSWLRFASEWDVCDLQAARSMAIHGIPASVRPIVWPIITGSAALMGKNPGTFSILLQRSSKDVPADVASAIRRDLAVHKEKKYI